MLTRQLLLPSLLAIALAGTAQLRAAPTPGDPAASHPELFDRLDANGDGRLTAAEIQPTGQRIFGRLLRTADVDGDHALSHDEFTAGLVPSQPDKPLVQNRTEEFYGADALQYLLLRMDTNGNRQIEQEEVPAEFREPFQLLVRKRDFNLNGTLDWKEMVNGGIHMAPIAKNWTDQHDIDVSAELAKLRNSMGPEADRFASEPLPGSLFGDRRAVRLLFIGLDHNGDKLVEASEVPEQFRDRFQQLVRLADGDRDGRLDLSEFRTAAQRLATLVDPAEREAGGLGDFMPDAADGPSMDSMERPTALP